MNRSFMVCLATGMLAACAESTTAPLTVPSDGPVPAFAPAATITTNNVFNVTLFVFVPCANGGSGELISVSGPLHDLFHVTFNSAGNGVLKFHDQPQGISGTGFVTGDKYQATGVTQETVNFNTGFELTFINNFRMIGQGPGNNFAVHDNFHITVNANGDVTSFHDNFSVDCK